VGIVTPSRRTKSPPESRRRSTPPRPRLHLFELSLFCDLKKRGQDFLLREDQGGDSGLSEHTGCRVEGSLVVDALGLADMGHRVFWPWSKGPPLSERLIHAGGIPVGPDSRSRRSPHYAWIHPT
jgi:hypothetical protein